MTDLDMMTFMISLVPSCITHVSPVRACVGGCAGRERQLTKIWCTLASRRNPVAQCVSDNGERRGAPVCARTLNGEVLEIAVPAVELQARIADVEAGICRKPLCHRLKRNTVSRRRATQQSGRTEATVALGLPSSNRPAALRTIRRDACRFVAISASLNCVA